MIFYCRKKRRTVNQKKAAKYCFGKTNCWAIKIFSNKRALAKFKNKN